MRIHIVSRGDAEAHPPSRALARQLRAAGNRVELVPYADDRSWLARRLGRPELVYPATRGDLHTAIDEAGRTGLVAAPVAWGLDASHDIAWAAPGEPRWSSSPAGPGVSTHVGPAAETAPWATPPGRHRGRRIAIAARWSPTTPARYLAEACERAGVDVRRVDRLDDAARDGVEAVLVVESPLPALAVDGDPTAGPPVLLWAHHGEHHTDAHARLVAHYRASAVLLAHSWHLAHRFPVPVHRFPFGVPLSIVDGGSVWSDRAFDAAFVGSGVDGTGAYRRRGELLGRLREELGADRVAIETDASPERLGSLYGDARLVPNDGGTRHRPITMRVFEAVGAGALLLTDDAPGLDRLFDPESHHVVIGDDVGRQARELLRSGVGERRAADALEHARGRHTTDHRVDEMFGIIDETARRPAPAGPPRPADPLLRPVADDLLLDDVLTLGSQGAEEQLPDRTVWPEERLERLDDRPLAHAVAVDATWRGDPDRAVRAARRVVVASRSQESVLERALAVEGASLRSEEDDVVTVDLGTPGYRIQP